MPYEFRPEWSGRYPIEQAEGRDDLGGRAMALAVLARSGVRVDMTRAREAAGRLGISPELAAMLPEECEERERAGWLAANPGLAAWAGADEGKARLAMENAGAMSGARSAFQRFGDGAGRGEGGAYGDGGNLPENGSAGNGAKKSAFSGENGGFLAESGKNGAENRGFVGDGSQELGDYGEDVGIETAFQDADGFNRHISGPVSAKAASGAGLAENDFQDADAVYGHGAVSGLNHGKNSESDLSSSGSGSGVLDGESLAAGVSDLSKNVRRYQNGVWGNAGAWETPVIDDDTDYEELGQEAGNSLNGRGLGRRFYAGGGAGTGENLKRSVWNGFSDLNQSMVGAAWALAENIWGKDSAIARFMKRGADYYGALRGPEPQPDNALSGVLYDAARLAPQMAANLTAGLGGASLAMGAGAAARLIGPGVSMGNMGAQIMGGSYVRAREEGVSPARALGASALNAALQAPLEQAGLKGILDVFTRAGSAGIISQAMRAATREGLTEAMQKAPEYVTDLWARAELEDRDAAGQMEWFAAELADVNNLREAMAEAAYEGLLGAIWGFGLAGGGGAFRKMERDGSPRGLFLDRISEMAGEAARRKALDLAMLQAREAIAEAPARADFEAMAAMAGASLPETARHAWISAEHLAALYGEYGDNTAPLDQILGNDRQALAATLDMGAPYQIAVGRVLASNDSELTGRLAGMMRMTPDGMSGEQARGWEPDQVIANCTHHILAQEEGESGEGEELEAGEYEYQLMADVADQRRVASAVRREKTRLAGMMLEAGYTGDTAKVFTELLAANAHAMQKAYGIDPAASMLARYRVERGENAEGGRRRGQVELSEREITIRLFDGKKDLSTLPHEAAHIFLHHLAGISLDDGSIARGRMAAAIDRALGQPGGDVARQIRRIAAKAVDEESIAKAREKLAELRKQARANMLEAKAAEAAELEKNQGRENEASTRFARVARDENYNIYMLNRASLAMRDCLGHMRGLEKAREDIALLKAWAGIAGDADMAPGGRDWRRLQERVARGMEQYIIQGEPPSARLSEAMDHMRQWLAGVYADNRQALGGEITPQISAVFDRMLATDREIRQAGGVGRAILMEEGFDGRTAGKLTADEARDLARLREQATARMRQRMDSATLKKRAGLMEKLKSGYLADVAASPFWSMVQSLETEKADFQEACEVLGLEAAGALMSARPQLFAREGGVNAEMFLGGMYMDAGFSVEDFYQRLYDAVVTDGLSEEIIAARMAEEELARRDAEGPSQEAFADAFGDYLDELDRIALRMASERSFREEQGEERRAWLEASATPRLIIGRQAKKALEDMPLRQIRPERFQSALQKALRDREKAMAAGDLAQARDAVARARLANEMIRQSLSTIRDVQYFIDFIRGLKSNAPLSMPAPHREAIHAVLERYRLGSLRNCGHPSYQRLGIRGLVESCMPPEDQDIVRPVFPDWLLDGQAAFADPVRAGNGMDWKHHPDWRDLPPDGIRRIRDLLSYIRNIGRKSAPKYRELEKSLEEDVAAGMDRLPERKIMDVESIAGRARESIENWMASVDSLLWICRKADGLANLAGEGEMGPMEKEYGKVIAAENRMRGRLETLSTLMSPHFEQLLNTAAALRKKYGKRMKLAGANNRPVTLPETLQKAYGRKEWTPDQVIALALNMGNESNIDRVKKGFPDLDSDTLAELLGDAIAVRVFGADMRAMPGSGSARQGLLSVADWQAIQGIWDALATQWEDTQTAHEEIFGFRPDAIDPEPLLLHENGKTVVLRGGYYPVKFDPRASQRVAEFSEKEDLMASQESLFQMPAAKKGHTITRKANVKLPLLLDTSVILSHCNDAVRFIEMGPLVRRLDRITHGAKFREAYVRVYGQADYNSIRPCLMGLVREEAAGKKPASGGNGGQIAQVHCSLGPCLEFQGGHPPADSRLSGNGRHRRNAHDPRHERHGPAPVHPARPVGIVALSQIAPL